MMRIRRLNSEEKNKFAVVLHDTSIQELLDRGLISVRSFNVCSNNELLNASDIVDFYNKHHSFLKLSSCGLKSNSELTHVVKLANMISPIDSEFDSLPSIPRQVFIDEYELFINDQKLDSSIKNAFTNVFRDTKSFCYLCLNDTDSLLSKLELKDSDNFLTFMLRSHFINLLVDISSHLSKLDVNDTRIEEFISKIPVIQKSFKDNYKADHFRYTLDVDKKRYLEENFVSLINDAPARAKSLQSAFFKTVYDVIPYIDLELNQFIPLFGNKRKSAVDFYNNVILLLRPVVSSIEHEGDEGLDLELKFRFPFVPSPLYSEIISFKKEHGHYPMFFILLLKLRYSNKREYDMVCRKYAIGQYDTSASLEEIAAAHNLTRERVRQIVSKPLFKHDSFIHSDFWLPYVKLGNHLITPDSEYFSNILSSENLNISFEAFAFLYCEVFQYEYCDKFISEFIVSKKLAQFVERIFVVLSGISKTSCSSEVSYTLDELFCKSDIDEPFKKNLILQEICPLFGLQVKGEKIIHEQNFVDVGKEAYDFLYSVGEPVHVDDILTHITSKYPSKKLSLVSLKFYLRNHPEISPVGKTSTYMLRHWRTVYSGNIRDLIRDIMSSHDKPLDLDILTDKVTDVFESTNRKNIHSSLSSCDDFIPFANGLWGLRTKNYPDEFVEVDLSRSRNSFEERFEQYKQFVNNFSRHPYTSGIEEEESLNRWQNNVMKRVLDVTEEQVNLLEEFISSTSHLPSNGREVKFYRNCQEYLDFVKKNFELPNRNNAQTLYFWFHKNLSNYKNYEDNRTVFFQNLIIELKGYGFYF